jgi:plastocyanin
MRITRPTNATRGVRPGLILFIAAAILALGACGSSSSGKSPSAAGSESNAAAGNNAESAPPAAGVTEDVSMQVLTSKMAEEDGYLGPDGNGHDTFMLANLSRGEAKDALKRSTLNVKVGDTIRVTVTNYDEGPHSFTVPGLGVNGVVAPAKNPDEGIPSKTTFTFVAKKTGKFRWYCAMPCDAKHGGWAMTAESGEADRVGYMAGYVVVS